jgi:hypothetical protein
VGLWRKIRRTGRVAEPAPPRPAEQPPGAGLCGSVQLGHVDAGSCNGCEIEIGSAFGPVYDAPGSTSYEAALPGAHRVTPSCSATICSSAASEVNGPRCR